MCEHIFAPKGGFFLYRNIELIINREVSLISRTIGLRRNPPDAGVASGQKPSTKIIYIILQTSVGLF